MYRRRRGSTLLLVILTAFALMGLLGAVVDFGLLRLTRQQLQHGAEVAALEGLRDFGDDDAPAARAGAVEAVDRFYADGRNAGPIIELSPGIGGLDAGTTIVGLAFHRPVLQSNPDNLAFGDVVLGRFNAEEGRHLESPGYDRTDFTPTAANPDALLVRLRRTHDPLGLDDQPGISGLGPTLPLLFGRGSTLAGGDPDAGFSLRHHGWTVRATAVAQARPALSVGLPDYLNDRPGAAPFGLTLENWAAFPVGAALEAKTYVPLGFGQAPPAVALRVDSLSIPSLEVPAGLEEGREVEAYVPLLASRNGTTAIAAFGAVRLRRVGNELAAEKLSGRLARANASAAWVPDGNEAAVDYAFLQDLLDPPTPERPEPPLLTMIPEVLLAPTPADRYPWRGE